MTALQAHQPQPPAGRPGAGPLTNLGPRQAVQVVKRIDDEFLALRAHRSRLWRDHPRYSSAVYELRDALRDASERYARTKIPELIDRLPRRSDLEESCRLSKVALEAKPKRDHLGLCVGRLIDSFPNARAHQPDMYRENLVHLAGRDGYSAHIVAEACDDIMRADGQAFLPAPADFLKACGKAKSAMETGWRLDWRALDALVGAELRLSALPPDEGGVVHLAPIPVDQELAAPEAPERSAFV